MKLNGTLDASNKIKLQSGFAKYSSPIQFIVRHEETPPTGAGNPSAVDTWENRTINTIVKNEVTGASLASNTITLPKGTYFIDCYATIFSVGICRMRLYDATSSSVILESPNSSGVSNTSQWNSNALVYLLGKFTLTQTSNLNIQMIVNIIDSSAQTNNEVYGRSRAFDTAHANWDSSITPKAIYLEAIFTKQ